VPSCCLFLSFHLPLTPPLIPPPSYFTSRSTSLLLHLSLTPPLSHSTSLPLHLSVSSHFISVFSHSTSLSVSFKSALSPPNMASHSTLHLSLCPLHSAPFSSLCAHSTTLPIFNIKRERVCTHIHTHTHTHTHTYTHRQ